MSTPITYKDHHIHYQVIGSGPTLLFLHGWPTNSKLWKAQVTALQATHRVISFDWLGFGQSDKPADHEYTFLTQKEILDTVLESLLAPDEKITLIAHDIGGPPAILWTSENESRVERLVLLNTVIYPFKTKLDALSGVILETPLLKNIFVSPFGLKMVLQTNTRSKGQKIKAAIKDILSDLVDAPSKIKQRTIHEPLVEGRANEMYQLSEKYQALQVAKDLIIAKEDPLCYAHILRLHQENPEVPVHTIPNCGHFIPIDRPEELNKILLGILGEAQ